MANRIPKVKGYPMIDVRVKLLDSDTEHLAEYIYNEAIRNMRTQHQQIRFMLKCAMESKQPRRTNGHAQEPV